MRGILITLICLCFISAGCCSLGTQPTPRAIGTSVDLNRKNYRTLKAAVQGIDGGFRLFGIIPFARVSEGDAMVNLYSKVDVEGKATSIMNVTREYANRYFILFSLPYVKITADVIEFIDENN
jgi:hypothetical protein